MWWRTTVIDLIYSYPAGNSMQSEFEFQAEVWRRRELITRTYFAKYHPRIRPYRYEEDMKYACLKLNVESVIFRLFQVYLT